MSHFITIEPTYEPTAEDWQEYASWADESDRRWWAEHNASWHSIGQSVPLDVLDRFAPFDMDQPDPSFEIPEDVLEAIHADRLGEERMAYGYGGYGHPSWPLS